MSGMKTEVREKLAQYLGALKNSGEKLDHFDRMVAALAALDDLMVIPADIARALTATTKEMLHNNLRGTLTGAEIDAAWASILPHFL